MKTSGSKRNHLINNNYSDNRQLQNKYDFDDLPSHESIKTTKKFFNNKINYGLLVRFLRGQIGNDWDSVYSEIISRIPTKLLDYKEMVYWFVADNVEIVDNKIWNKKTQKFIWIGEGMTFDNNVELKEFYVDPNSNELKHIQQKSFKRISKKNN